MIDFLTKAYVLKNFAADAVDFVKDRMEDMELDFDREALLHRVGLTSYRPTQRVVGALGLFCIGAVLGSALGLAFAQKTGDQFRARVRERAKNIFGAGMMAGEELGRREAKFDQPRM